MIKRILVGLADELHAAAATWHAIELARSHGAEVTALAMVDVARLGRVLAPIRLGLAKPLGNFVSIELR